MHLGFDSLYVLNRLRQRIQITALCVMIAVLLGGAWNSAAALTPATITTTALTVSSNGGPVTTVASGSVVTLTATVTAGSTSVKTGQVNFCDATAAHCTDIHLLGTAQLTGAGTAIMMFRPGMGGHSYKAVFLPTSTYATSASSATVLTVTGSLNSSTTITQSGIAGNYSLTATVTGAGLLAPTGNVSFLDTSNANAVLGTGGLGGEVTALNFLNPQTPATGTATSAVAVGDFNGDGIPDLAVTSQSTNTVAILLGNGDGTFTTKVKAANFTVGSQPDAIVAGDFNGDGKVDLAIADQVGGTVTILLGNGDGTFNLSGSTVVGPSPYAMVAGDFNGDGILDLVVPLFGYNAVTIMQGKGDGTFVQAGSLGTGSGPISVAAADFNGDGLLDLAIADKNSNSITILLNQGNWVFTTAASPATGTTPISIATADFNGDGIPDLAVANLGNASVTILLGKGDGTFTPAASLSSVYGPTAIAVGDFNGDGKVDLAVTNEGDGATGSMQTVSIFLGNGDGTFTLAASPATGVEPTSIAVGDFNGDGSQDLAIGNFGNSSVSILTSQLTQTATATVNSIAVTGKGNT